MRKVLRRMASSRTRQSQNNMLFFVATLAHSVTTAQSSPSKRQDNHAHGSSPQGPTKGLTRKQMQHDAAGIRSTRVQPLWEQKKGSGKLPPSPSLVAWRVKTKNLPDQDTADLRASASNAMQKLYLVYHEHRPFHASHGLELLLGLDIAIVCLVEIILLVCWNHALELLQCLDWAPTTRKAALDVSWRHPSSVILRRFHRLLNNSFLGIGDGLHGDRSKCTRQEQGVRMSS